MMERIRARVRSPKTPRHRRPCVCQPLHSGCDPDRCEKAVEPPLRSWIDNYGLTETLFLYGRAGEWTEGASQGCLTCAVVSKLAGKYVRPEERIAVQRKAREFLIFGEHVYKDDNDRRRPPLRLYTSI